MTSFKSIITMAALAFTCFASANNTENGRCSNAYGLLQVKSRYARQDFSRREGHRRMLDNILTFHRNESLRDATGAAISVKVPGASVADDRYFIISNAHLTRGDHLTERLGEVATFTRNTPDGVGANLVFKYVERDESGILVARDISLVVVKRRADTGFNDIEVLEVERQSFINADISVMFDYVSAGADGFKFRLNSQDLLQDPGCFAQVGMGKQVRGDSYAGVPYTLQLATWLRRDVVTMSPVDSLISELGSTTLEGFSVHPTFGKLELYAPAQTFGGVSGSPLLVNQSGHDGIFLAGIFKRYEYYFHRSYFASMLVVESLFQDVLVQQVDNHTINPSITFRAHRDIFVKEYGGGIFDSFFGDYHGSSDGNGGSGDGSDGNGGSGDGSGGRCGRASCHDPREFLRRNHIFPGIQLPGVSHPVIGFEYGNGSSLPASRFSIDFNLRMTGQLVLPTYVVLDQSLDLIQRFRTRMGGDPDRHHFMSPLRNVGDALSFHRLVIDSLSSRMSFRLHGFESGETVHFHIEKNGRVTDENDRILADQYQPWIAVVSNRGKIYFIELSGLFFDHQFMVSIDGSIQTSPGEYCDPRSRGALISIRREDMPREWRIQFSCGEGVYSSPASALIE